MEIVYMLGNGFDLNLGLKTSYKSFYEYYISTKSDNDVIKKFKETLSKNIELWSDLEVELGKYSLNFTVNNKNNFIELLENIQDHLALYFITQNSQLDNSVIKKEKIFQDLISPTKYLDERDKQNFRKFLSLKPFNSSVINVSVITFNYTNTFEQIINWKNKHLTIPNLNGYAQRELNLRELIHIHGTTESNLILGVNDENQIANSEISNDLELVESFVKPKMNFGTRTLRHEKCVDLLTSANIICIFGMSFGETDKIWWELLVNNIQAKNQKIIIFNVAQKFSKLREYKFNGIKNNIKEKLLSYGNIEKTDLNNILENIYVVLNSEMFNCKENTIEISKEIA